MAFRLRVILWFIATGGLVATSLHAQTCSCAGAPLIGTQSAGATSAGNLVVGLTYGHNDISSTFSGSSRLADDISTRSTQSLLLEINYGITSRISISTTMTFVNKHRTTGLSGDTPANALAARGPGDGVLLMRYAVLRQNLWNPYSLVVGGGFKAPIGSFSLMSNGLQLNADMQPGTGAWDGLLWSYASASLRRGSPLHAYSVNSYRHTGARNRFSGEDSYRFGSEWTSVVGTGGELVSKFSYDLGLSFRATNSDRLNGISLPNTGGKWLSVTPAVIYTLSDMLALRIAGSYPIWQHLNGTQPTTSFVVGGSLFVNLNRADNDFIQGDPRR